MGVCGKGSEDISKPYCPPCGYGRQEAEVTVQETSQGDVRMQQIREMTKVLLSPLLSLVMKLRNWHSSYTSHE